MAEGAVLVCLAYGAWALVKARADSGQGRRSCTIIGLGTVGIRITSQYTPVLDDTWRAIIRDATPYNFPADWDPSDWLTVIGSVASVSAAAYVMRARPPLPGSSARAWSWRSPGWV